MRKSVSCSSEKVLADDFRSDSEKPISDPLQSAQIPEGLAWPIPRVCDGATIAPDGSRFQLGNLRVCSISHQAAISEDIRGLWRRATLRIMNRHPASFTQATELATVLSTSLARRRQRPIHAKVRSTTQRRDKTVNPLAPLGLGTISISSDTPNSFSASCSFGPA